MKKTLLLFIATISFVAYSYAELFEIKMSNGSTFNGRFLSRSDSTLSIKDFDSGRIICLNASDFISAKTQVGGSYYTKDGKVYGCSRSEYNKGQKERKNNKGNIQPCDPNYVIGISLYKTGKASLIFGVPTMVTGAILMACGYAKPNQLKQMTKDKEAGKEIDAKRYSNLLTDVANNGDKYTNCATAGCVLLPFGSALTIIGIPLVSHGKEIMNLSLQVSENGPGLAVNF